MGGGEFAVHELLCRVQTLPWVRREGVTHVYKASGGGQERLWQDSSKLCLGRSKASCLHLNPQQVSSLNPTAAATGLGKQLCLCTATYSCRRK